jgi:ribonuclease E
MTAIDVNSARSTKGKDIEETAYKTNLEAAKEIARQLRLRDVGGLVVIDFIDMTNEDNQNKVESAFRKAIYSDRARVQISNISRFGLLEVSRQRLRPSLNESYDIEHVLVRGPRSLGQSILRIIGEDAAKDNTGEIQVYVPADVASYLLNEKRYDIINIEKTSNIKILIIADPYKARPYYKVVRIKSSDRTNTDSYNLTPNSPEPDTDWRDSKNQSRSMKPLVSGVKPPKMPKRKQDGLIKWLKSFAGISDDAVKKPKKPTYKKHHKKNNKSTTRSTGGNKNYKANKNINKVKNIKPKQNNKPSNNRSNEKTVNKNSVDKKPVNRKPVNKKPVNEKPVKSKKVNVDKHVKNDKPLKKDLPKQDVIKKSPIKEIVKEKKEKKPIPTRAKNDPRQMS